MSRTPAALFLLADHREREALAEATRARNLNSVAPASFLGVRTTLYFRRAVAMTIAAIVAREPFGAVRREAALHRPFYRWGR